MTEFSVICTTFLPFLDFISFYFDLSTNHVITICKASLLARHDIDRMENWEAWSADFTAYAPGSASGLRLVHQLLYFWSENLPESIPVQEVHFME